jgi:hypothetical protein
MRIKICTLVYFVCLLPLTAVAQESRGTFSLYFENDAFVNTDRYYTNGVKIAWGSPNLKNSPDKHRLLGLMYSLGNKLSIFRKGDFHHVISISFGQNIYTPDDIKQTDLIEEDRPYAGMAYVGAAFHSKSRLSLSSFEFNLGIVGPHAFSKEIQELIHELTGADHPNGWGNQLKDEIALGVNYDYKLKLLKPRIKHRFGFDLISHLGGGLGNAYSGISTGAQVRLGWDLPDDFGIVIIRPSGGAYVGSPFSSRHKFGVHAFAGLNAHTVLRNALLEGNTFHDSHRVEKNLFTADIMAGIALSINRFKISYTHVYRTKRFKTQKHEQVYGSINISFSY